MLPLSGPAARCRLQPHVRLIEARHEVDTLLLEVRESAKRKGGAPRTITAQKESRARRSTTPVYLAIHRFELVVHYKRLDAEIFRLLNAVAQGASHRRRDRDRLRGIDAYPGTVPATYP